MEIEVLAPSHASEINFDSTTSSPYITAPSSPTRFGNTFFFLSAPTSPSSSDSWSFRSSNAPFDPAPADEFSRKRSAASVDFSQDFEFDFSGHLEKGAFSAADELFHGGKIRPLRPPPGYEQASSISSPRSKSLKKDGSDLFQKETGESQRKTVSDQRHRGRERSQGVSSSDYVHNGSRSLSPLRVSDIMLEEDEEHENSSVQSARFVSSAASNHKSSVSSAILSALSFPGRAYKKWKLKDLLLFRSASEGRPVPTRQYEILTKKVDEEAKNSSFRSVESGGGSSTSGSRRRSPAVSAHELHYTANRTVSEELKRKTFLPYKQGWLGCIGFNPGAHHIARVGSLTRGGP